MGFAAFVACLSLVAFWIAGGHAVVPRWLVPSPGLSLSEVKIDPLRLDDRSYLVVHGLITNDSPATRAVPLVAIETDEQPMPAVPYYVRADRDRLTAGESASFHARLPAAVRDYGALTVTLAGAGNAR